MLHKPDIAHRRIQTGSMKFAIRRHLLAAAVAAVLLVGGIGGWAATTEISGAVIAAGQLATESDDEKVQYQPGGTVAAVGVAEGDTVKAGDVLVKFDDSVLAANLSIIVNNLEQLQVRAARLEAERDGLDDISFGDAIEAASQTNAAVAAAIAAEQKSFLLRRETREGQKSQLHERVAQYDEEIKGLNAQLAAKQSEVSVLTADLAGLTNLQDQNLVLKQQVSDISLELAEAQGGAGLAASQAAQDRGKIAEINFQILDIDRSLRSDDSKELAELQGQIAELQERQIAAQDEVAKAVIRAPQGGEIQELNVHTIGGVVGPGETMMLIVPVGDHFRVEAHIAPQDIDHVTIGQPVLLRFSAFNLRSTPELNGTVAGVSPDLITDQRTGTSHYDVRITIDSGEIDRLHGLHLTVGMPVESFIHTNDRSALSYFTKPVADFFERSFRSD